MKRRCGEASALEQPVVRNLSALIFAIPIRSLRTKQSQTKNETLQAQPCLDIIIDISPLSAQLRPAAGT